MHVGVDVDAVTVTRFSATGRSERETAQALGLVLPLLQSLLLGGKAVIGVGRLEVENASGVLHFACTYCFPGRLDIEGRVDWCFEMEGCVGVKFGVLWSTRARTRVVIVVFVEMFAWGQAEVGNILILLLPLRRDRRSWWGHDIAQLPEGRLLSM